MRGRHGRISLQSTWTHTNLPCCLELVAQWTSSFKNDYRRVRQIPRLILWVASQPSTLLTNSYANILMQPAISVEHTPHTRSLNLPSLKPRFRRAAPSIQAITGSASQSKRISEVFCLLEVEVVTTLKLIYRMEWPNSSRNSFRIYEGSILSLEAM